MTGNTPVLLGTVVFSEFAESTSFILLLIAKRQNTVYFKNKWICILLVKFSD